ncbi:TetR/AcrR family transcriptional regulator [Streptomyces sp. NPDC051940]|uniref:TetR/AcrR family transcriptional regulator n=1 Tax=Streptomyces sp. NPDC051940 TaxID=3155675 RepID=UPI003436836F
MTDTTVIRRSRLSAEREHEVFDAVLELLRENGYESLTMDAIAARTHASKATLYRQWKGKPELVATALRHAKSGALPDPDTGSLRGDLRLLASYGLKDADSDHALMRGLAQAAHAYPELHEAMRELLILPELEKIQSLLRRAVDRGEVPADSPALEFVPHMLCGAFVTREWVEDQRVDLDYLTRYLDAVVFPALGVE